MPYRWIQAHAGAMPARVHSGLPHCGIASGIYVTTSTSACISQHMRVACWPLRAAPMVLAEAERAAAAARPSSYLVSELNRDVLPATSGEFKPLRIGSKLSIWPPVWLAPMAGLTSTPMRQLCYQHGCPLATSEMIIASTLVKQNRESLHLASFAESEPIRSAQLYGVQPDLVERAARWLVQQRGVQHIDLNLGCPVRKVTSKGGGSALPLRTRLAANIIAAAVRGAGSDVPVTLKMRIGVSAQLRTHLATARIAQEEGASAVTLHARTADQLYSPPPDWLAVQELVAAVDIPVVGNGDIFEAADALRMMRQTGCAGVMVGRGCLGRPWLFSELADMLGGQYPGSPPALGQAVAAMADHLQRWAAHEGSSTSALLKMRKLVPCYLHGYQTAHTLQDALLHASSEEQWHQAVQQGDYDPNEPASTAALRHARLKGAGGPRRQRVALPQGWLEGADSDEIPSFLDDDACEG